MLLTVAICTWNRWELLRQALEQMTRLLIPPGIEWELLVVNNNCTDATDQVIAAYSTRLPIRRVFEPNPGQSNARNAAVREARGEHILWTDDDVMVDQNWLAAYVKAFETWPDAVFFGGPVRPWFAVPPPAWLTRVWPRVAGVYATRELGGKPLRFDGGERVPFGANFAVRLREQRQYLYDPRLGLKPGSNLRSEETTLIKALLADGYKGWWVPEAGVRHYIPPERMTIRYLREYHFGAGEYEATVEAPWNGPTLFGRPRWAWRQVILSEAKYLAGRLLCKPEIWIQGLRAASIARGYLARATTGKRH